MLDSSALLWVAAVAAVLAGSSVALAQPTSRPLPADDEYVTVKDGHLFLKGQRQRYWGFIGHFWLTGKLDQYNVKAGDSPQTIAEKVKKRNEVIDAYAKRIRDLGFNIARVWFGKSGVDWNHNYTPGDGSQADYNAYVLWALQRNGVKLWMTPFNNFGVADPDKDVSLVDDPATAQAWSAAVREMTNRSPRFADVGAWDPRMRAVHLRQMKHIAEFPNKYKDGLRLCDDPENVVWELTNEEWMFSHLVNGQWQKLPKFFRDGLQAKWSQFLAGKYKDDAGLAKAWGFLLPDESIAKNTVLLAPLASPSDGKFFNDGNAAAIAALTASKQTFSRDDFTRQRGADVLEFFSELQIAYKTDRRDFAKSLGKSLKLSPMVLDTGDGFRIQSVYMHQFGDASSMCSYIWQTATSRDQKRFPFMSGLDEQPRMAMGLPWVEVGKIPGKPFFVYEFQMNNPDKYRAEVPYRIAALGVIQDWDIINFHLFGRPNDPALEEPYREPIAYSVYDPNWGGATVEGVHYKADEVYASAMRAAGLFFVNSTLKGVASPTVMTFGRKSLYDPVSATYGKSFGEYGDNIAPTAWQYGCQMVVDPSQEKDSAAGRMVDRGLMEINPVKPTDQITFDWQKSFMQFDAPGGVAWTGFLGEQREPAVTFSSGIRLSDARVINDEGVNYPVSDGELYISFAAVAEDGAPLEKSKKVMVSLVSTSFNWGFKLNHDNVAAGDFGHRGTPYKGMVKGGDVKGKPPVAYVRAGATVIAPPMKGMKFRWLDWHFKEIGAGVVGGDGKLVIPADKPIFYVELTR
jgi:hypothetical protein